MQRQIGEIEKGLDIDPTWSACGTLRTIDCIAVNRTAIKAKRKHRHSCSMSASSIDGNLATGRTMRRFDDAISAGKSA
jgi:hypothetical protein